MKFIMKIIAALLLAVVSISSANAQISNKHYARINAPNGYGWVIKSFYDANGFLSCGAITAESYTSIVDIVLELRFSDWMIGRSDDNPVSSESGRILAGNVGENLHFEPVGLPGFTWASALNRRAVDAIRGSGYLIIEYPSSEEKYSLSGSTDAMLKVEECVSVTGNKPAKRVARNNPRPQPLQPRNNQPGNSQISEQFYGEARGWEIVAVINNTNNDFYCAATVVGNRKELRIAHGAGNKWAIGMRTSRVGSSYGQLNVSYGNGQVFFAGTVSYVNDGDGWAATVLNREFIGHLKSGDSVGLDIGQGSVDNFSLSGSTAAMLKLQECVRNKGRKPARRVAQVPRRQAIQPAPRRQINIPLKSQLSGTWQWSDPVKHSKNNLIISTIEMVSNSTANYCYGVFCWDVTFTPTPGFNDTAQFSTDGVNLFRFVETGPNALSGEFYESGFTNVLPDARVQMR